MGKSRKSIRSHSPRKVGEGRSPPPPRRRSPPTSDNQGVCPGRAGQGQIADRQTWSHFWYHGQLLYSNSSGHLYKHLGGGQSALCVTDGETNSEKQHFYLAPETWHRGIGRTAY